MRAVCIGLASMLFGVTALGSLPGVSAAAAIATTATTVMPQTTIFYGVYGSGDVVFKLTSNSQPQCVGYWLRSSDAGLKNELAALMISISTQASLVVYADDAILWSGSTDHYCLVGSISL